MLGHRERGVERVGKLIDRSLPERVRASMEGWRAIDLWPGVAGPDAARRSVAKSFRDGRLIVEVVSSVWMHQLAASKRRLIRAINDQLGAAVVDDLLFRVNPTLTSDACQPERGTEADS